MTKTLNQIWSEPPPGTTIVKEGVVKEGDWFYIEQLGAWAPVPKIGWGEPIANSLIARGTLDQTQVQKL